MAGPVTETKNDLHKFCFTNRVANIWNSRKLERRSQCEVAKMCNFSAVFTKETDQTFDEIPAVDINYSVDIEGGPKFKSRSRDPGSVPI